MRFVFTLFLFILAISHQAQAGFFRAELPTPGADSSLGTHIIIVGAGMEVGDQFLRAGHSQALMYRDRPRRGGTLLIGAIDSPRTSKMLAEWGYQNTRISQKTFSSEALLSQIATVPRIASIDFLGHNGAILGFVLENYENRFFLAEARKLAAFRDRMTKDSFVRVVGCNTGWKLAPLIADALGVPASGTFTYADLQNLHETGEFYFHDKGRYPEGKFQAVNDRSFFAPLTCEYFGGCTRLKVVNIPYQGRHGSYKGTLPFLKTFCGSVPAQDCFRRMAISLQSSLGLQPLEERPSRERYAEAVAEFLCPGEHTKERIESCRQPVLAHFLGVKALSATWSPGRSLALSCSFKKCSFKEEPGTKSPIQAVSNGKASTAFMDELNAYQLGYEQMLKQ